VKTILKRIAVGLIMLLLTIFIFYLLSDFLNWLYEKYFRTLICSVIVSLILIIAYYIGKILDKEA